MADHQSHGNTPAAWTAVILLIVAAAVLSFAVVFTSVLLTVIGLVIGVVGAVAGKLLSLAGYGGHAAVEGDSRASRG